MFIYFEYAQLKRKRRSTLPATALNRQQDDDWIYVLMNARLHFLHAGVWKILELFIVSFLLVSDKDFSVSREWWRKRCHAEERSG